MRMRCMISSGRRRETRPRPHSPCPKNALSSVLPLAAPALSTGCASSRSTAYDTADWVDQNSGKCSGARVSFCLILRGCASSDFRASRIRLYATVSWLKCVLLRASTASLRFTSNRRHISTSTCSLSSSEAGASPLSSSSGILVRTSAGDARYPGRFVLNQLCARSWLTVMRWRGSTTSMRGIRSRHPSLRYPGIVYTPPLIFLNRLAMFSSSKGRFPHSSANRITPQDHMSTSDPAYSCPEMTSGAA
mmetsp:Transcript_24914/g.49838  ORF Transcript_24914/g.49838 Transcript_24914/m.49838 type:complete len:248 (+) Transcript_24914:852-1595(+)